MTPTYVNKPRYKTEHQATYNKKKGKENMPKAKACEGKRAM